MTPPKTKGRQKIQMTRMADESRLSVTFSKRHSGLFKKASELCTLCGVELAIIVVSPSRKVLSFGHPSVESIVDRFLTQNPPPSSSASQLMEVHRNGNIQELNRQLSDLLSQLETEKEKCEKVKEEMKESQDKYWWEAPIENLGLEEVEQLKMAMAELKKIVAKHAEKLMVESSNSTPISQIFGSTGGVAPPK